MFVNKKVKVIIIDCFLNDNICRIVYRYGGFFRNEGSDLINFFIEVLLVEF